LISSLLESARSPRVFTTLDRRRGLHIARAPYRDYVRERNQRAAFERIPREAVDPAECIHDHPITDPT
jgi:hypothetical protein